MDGPHHSRGAYPGRIANRYGEVPVGYMDGAIGGRINESFIDEMA
jgi:hypothetical protein